MAHRVRRLHGTRSFKIQGVTFALNIFANGFQFFAELSESFQPDTESRFALSEANHVVLKSSILIMKRFARWWMRRTKLTITAFVGLATGTFSQVKKMSLVH
jgi:hypothetical protein